MCTLRDEDEYFDLDLVEDQFSIIVYFYEHYHQDTTNTYTRILDLDLYIDLGLCICMHYIIDTGHGKI